MADIATPAFPEVATLPDGSGAIRRWARWLLTAYIVKVVAIFTALTFRLGGLLDVAGIGQGIAIFGLMWSLRLALPEADERRATLVTGIGLTGIALNFLDAIVYQFIPVVPVIGLLGQILIGGWLVAFGASQPRIRAPLPRRAVVGGIGYALLAVWSYAPREPLFLVIGLPGVVLAISFLGFVFGLMDLERLEPSASA